MLGAMLTIYRHVESRCLRCGYRMDASSGINQDDAPEEGDVTVCLACGDLYAFDAALRLRPVPQDELTALPEDVRRAIADALGRIRLGRN